MMFEGRGDGIPMGVKVYVARDDAFTFIGKLSALAQGPTQQR